MARKLLEFAGDFGSPTADGIRIETQLNQTDIASLVGATRERTNKALRELRAAGIIAIGKGTILICDMPALQEAAGWG